MYPSLTPGEYVIFDQLAYRNDSPQRGDIVLATQPGSLRRLIIKRVAGLPGDQVALDEESFLVTNQPYGEAKNKLMTEALRTLSADEYVLLGDSPDLSTDSRQFGSVRLESILGRAWLVYWPPSRVRRVTDERSPIITSRPG